MQSGMRALVIWVALNTGPAALPAQFSFAVGGRQIQIHSFASQGFAHSNDNNYLTMQTSRGSFGHTVPSAIPCQNR
jgi:hypothetical protein